MCKRNQLKLLYTARIKQLDINKKKVKIQLWYISKVSELITNFVIFFFRDTAGQERYNTITQSYYRGVHGVIVAFDVCERSSFDNVKKWMRDIDEYTGNNKRKVRMVFKISMR